MEEAANCTEEGYQETHRFKQRKKIDVRQSEKKEQPLPHSSDCSLVDDVGLEPATFRTSSGCSTS